MEKVTGTELSSVPVHILNINRRKNYEQCTSCIRREETEFCG